MSQGWGDLRYLTCSVLPVRVACNLSCPFCFSRSSISALSLERADWSGIDVEGYYARAREMGAARLVITGGGEPLLKPELVLWLVSLGRRYFGEIACFTNGSRLTRGLAEALQAAGLSYLCWSRHAVTDEANRALMGAQAPDAAALFAAAGSLPVRATCVMARGQVDSREAVWAYLAALRPYGVREFTFKHTYVAYPGSVFGGSAQDSWARAHQVEWDPFEGQGERIGALPWGPEIRVIEGLQVCYYREPTPAWELENGIGRSLNLLSDGSVYGSLEERQSRLWTLTSS
jgi:pyruvate-formate lyase-activating enzyme